MTSVTHTGDVPVMSHCAHDHDICSVSALCTIVNIGCASIGCASIECVSIEHWVC